MEKRLSAPFYMEETHQSKVFLQKNKKDTKKVLTFYIVHSILNKSVAKTTKTYGILAQLGEHLPYKQRVIGSSPIGPTYGNNAKHM